MPADTPADAPPSAAYADAARAEYRLLRRLMIASLMLGCAGCFAFNMVDPDLWGHVRYGQEWIEAGQMHRTATHTFTAEGYRWVNHENLAELAFAWGFDHLGVGGMLIAKCLAGMLIIGLMLMVAGWRAVRPLTACAFLLLVAVNLKAFFPMRPQLLSFLCCAAMLTLLEAAFLHWRRPFRTHEPAQLPARPAIDWRPLAFVPVVLVVWVNSHGGFAAGVCIACAYLFGRGVEMLIDRRPGDLPKIAGLAAVAAACVLAVFANPYGTGLVAWMAESLGSPRPEITEWAGPKPSDPIFWQLVALGFANAIAWGFTKKQRDWVKIVILMLVAWQAVSHLRHIAFFALLSGFWTPPHVQSVLSAMRSKAANGLEIVRPAPLMKWAAVAAILFTTYVQTRSLASRLFVLPVASNQYPVDALQYIEDHELSGRLVVSFNWAQYALAALAPDTTVSFDGRFRTCYPQEVVDMNFDFLLGEHGGARHRSPNSGPIDGARVLSYGDPNLVLVDRTYPHAVEVMRQQSADQGGRWSLLYQDAISQLWGLANRYDQPTSPNYVAPDSRSIGDQESTRLVQWPAFPQRRGGVANRPQPEKLQMTRRADERTIPPSPGA